MKYSSVFRLSLLALLLAGCGEDDAGTTAWTRPEEPAAAFDQALSGDSPRELEEPAAAALPEEEEISVPLGSIETMVRFDEPGESAESAALPEKRRTSKSDFPPKKEGGGILYWIGMAVAFVIVMTLALLAGYFWVYPERGLKTIDLVKSFFLGL